MDIEQSQNKINTNNHNRVHFVLLNSYLIFLFAVILGVFLDPFIDGKIFIDSFYQKVGFIMLLLGSILIYWAQSTSSVARHKINENNTTPYFYFKFGPYKYLRNPTHLGLFVITVGFSLIIYSLSGVILNIVAYMITRFFFYKKEAKLLELKYGQDYLEHKKKVKNWI